MTMPALLFEVRNQVAYLTLNRQAAQVTAKAEEIASAIAANGPIAVRAIKQGVPRAVGHPFEEGFKIENEVARSVMKSEDAREGPRAFIEKRKPVYKGR
jgi:enoyl-CoA hydratase